MPPFPRLRPAAALSLAALAFASGPPASAASPPLEGGHDDLRVAVDELGAWETYDYDYRDRVCRLYVILERQETDLARDCGVRDADLTSDAERNLHAVWVKADGRRPGIRYQRSFGADGAVHPGARLPGTRGSDRDPSISLVGDRPVVSFTRRVDGRPVVMRIADARTGAAPRVLVRDAAGLVLTTAGPDVPAGAIRRVEAWRARGSRPGIVVRIDSGPVTRLDPRSSARSPDAVILADGTALVAWAVPSGSASGVWYARLHADGRVEGPVRLVAHPASTVSMGRSTGWLRDPAGRAWSFATPAA